MSNKEYHKIETPYMRDMSGNKKLIEGLFRSDTTSFLKDCRWVFTEKIDGTNIRIYWDGHKVSIGGRTYHAMIPPRLYERLDYLFKGNVNEEVFEQLFGDSEAILYGEGYGVGIQAVGKEYLTDSNDFILFDVLFNNRFLDYESIQKIARALNIKTVPISLVGTIEDAVKYVKTKPTSSIGTCVIEGVVGRPVVELYDKHGNRVITKIKVKDFADE